MTFLSAVEESVINLGGGSLFEGNFIYSLMHNSAAAQIKAGESVERSGTSVLSCTIQENSGSSGC